MRRRARLCPCPDPSSLSWATACTAIRRALIALCCRPTCPLATAGALLVPKDSSLSASVFPFLCHTSPSSTSPRPSRTLVLRRPVASPSPVSPTTARPRALISSTANSTPTPPTATPTKSQYAKNKIKCKNITTHTHALTLKHFCVAKDFGARLVCPTRHHEQPWPGRLYMRVPLPCAWFPCPIVQRREE